MKYKNVNIEAIKAYLPPGRLSSLEVEEMMSPVYQRLNLSKGRLELFTGIKERRYWPLTTKPSDVSIGAGKAALEAAGLEPSDIDALIHCSVCPDFPAIAFVLLLQQAGQRPHAFLRPAEAFQEQAFEHDAVLREIHIVFNGAAVVHDRTEKHVDQQRFREVGGDYFAGGNIIRGKRDIIVPPSRNTSCQSAAATSKPSARSTRKFLSKAKNSPAMN